MENNIEILVEIILVHRLVKLRTVENWYCVKDY